MNDAISHRKCCDEKDIPRWLVINSIYYFSPRNNSPGKVKFKFAETNYTAQLIDIRRKHKISIKELSRMLSTRYETISYLEKDLTKKMRLITLLKFLAFYGPAIDINRYKLFRTGKIHRFSNLEKDYENIFRIEDPNKTALIILKKYDMKIDYERLNKIWA